MKITRKLVDAGKLAEIAVLDHIIVGQDQFYLFADDGNLCVIANLECSDLDYVLFEFS